MNPGAETPRAAENNTKMGLALSGGGFRASFFHLGVLAQMARHGTLRHVEVISTVSGGSIIGALYYIEVKNLLETKCDADIEDSDYVKILEKIETHFLERVQLNPRMLTFADIHSTMRMFRPDYSRSDRMGEIYDTLFYRPALKPHSPQPIRMRDLRITPLLADGTHHADFDPDEDNAQRKATVPVLLINATALNNGHNWRFEAVRMGTSPLDSLEEREIDKNCRLLRADRYEDITPRQQDMELGLAVAASACVPGIFHPLAISGLYDQEVRVQLVDGGVHDNQGIQGLLDRHCNVLMVSDASGQMCDELEPPTRIAEVTSRTNHILMNRVRHEQLLHLKRRSDVETFFVHLRKGIESRKITWIGADEKPWPHSTDEDPQEESSTSFGVHPEVQEQLSLIRTDLDSFSDVEAFSLMMNGYLMTGWEMQRKSNLKRFMKPEDETLDGKWKFLEIGPWMNTGAPSARYLKHLRVGSKRVFKAFRLQPLLSAPILAASIVLLGWMFLSSPLANVSLTLSFRQLTLLSLFILLGYFAPSLPRIFKPLNFLNKRAGTMVSLVMRAILPAAIVPLVKLHLRFIDPWFLRSGRVSRLKERK